MKYITKEINGTTYNYTGLNDKMGNELWEYDIVMTNTSKAMYIVLFGELQWRYGLIALTVYIKSRDKCKSYKSFLRYITPSEVTSIRKIGSIHENPELMI